MAQQLLDVNAADDVVRVAGVYGISRVRLGPHDFPQILASGAHPNPNEVNARHHHLAGDQIAELEQLAQDLAALTAEKAALLALLNDELQLLSAVITLLLGQFALNADRPQDHVADGHQRDDDRQERLLQPFDQGRHVESSSRRTL